MRTAVAWLIDALQQRGVTSIATLCGHGLDPLFEAATHAGLRLVDTRNEQTAGYVAEATGRLTRIPGVCASSSGVAWRTENGPTAVRRSAVICPYTPSALPRSRASART